MSINYLSIDDLDGPGASPNELTFQSQGLPLVGASVWLSSDALGVDVVAGTEETNSEGKVVFLLSVGVTYYVWMQKSGYNDILGEAFVAT